MDPIVSSWWIFMFGALGGALNALVTDNRHLLPRRVAVSAVKRIVRLGIVGNMAVGTIAAFAVFAMLVNNDAAFEGPSALDRYAVVLAGTLVGLTAARAVTSEADKQLLRAAVQKACAAPAAHPDSLKSIDALTPLAVYALTDTLMPQRPFVRQHDEPPKMDTS